MSDKIKKYITQDPEIKGGIPIINGTRVSVAEILDLLEGHNFVNAVIKNLRTEGVIVTEEEVSAALEYAKYSALNEALTKKNGK